MCIRVRQYTDFHIVISSFAHDEIYRLSTQGGAKNKSRNTTKELGVHYQNANKMNTSNSEFPLRLLATNANECK